MNLHNHAGVGTIRLLRYVVLTNKNEYIVLGSDNIEAGYRAINLAGLVGEDDSIPYLLVDAIFTALGKVFEGVRIIFMLSLFKDLEKN